MKIDQINTIRQAAEDMRMLRRRNEILEAQVAIVHVFAAALGIRGNGGGMAPDMVWALEKMAEEATHNLVPPEKTAE